jgi:hypothetical protein
MDISDRPPTSNIHPLPVPNASAMAEHLEHLFGGYLDGFHEGLIELSWTDHVPNSDGRYPLRHAELFGTDRLDELVEKAVKLNTTPQCNVYVGAALRRPETPPFGRASDNDVWALTCGYADLDDPGVAEAAKSVYLENKPTIIVVTGREPYRRAQLWWRLEEPVTDHGAITALIRGIAQALNGDVTVANPSRVMRLAGSIAWPVKPGRQVELTYIAPLKEPGQREYSFEHLVILFPPIQTDHAGLSVPSNQGEKVNTGPISREMGPLGPGRVNDGRDIYLTKTVAAVLIQLIGETGACPTPQQLIDAVWPQYSRNTDLTRPGKGPELVVEKCSYAIRRFTEGKIQGCRNLDEAVAIYAKKGRSATSATFQSKFVTPEEQRQHSSGPLVLTAEQFVAGFTPPAYLIDGILQRGYLYSLTARTGHGKTAVAMYIAQCVARGQMMHGCPVLKGTVLLLAGENPDDIRARFMILADTYGFHAESLKMRFVAGVVDIASRMPEIRAAAAEIDDLVLVIVDTAAAYFPGDDQNSNSQQGAYARLLRELTFLPGKPSVIVNCHPIKNAARDNLLPMGGSSFLNEIDGNLTLWSNSEKQVTMHWQGKFRGPEFNPVSFEIAVGQSERVKDAKDRRMPNAVAKPLSDEDLAAAEAEQQTGEDKLLRQIYRSNRASLADLAARIGSSKSAVGRMCMNLKSDRLIEIHRGRYRLTVKGEKEIGVGGRDDDENTNFG